MSKKYYLMIFPQENSLKSIILEIIGMGRIYDGGLLNPTLTYDYKLGIKSKALWKYIYRNKLHEGIEVNETKTIRIPKELVLKLKRLARRKPLSIRVKRVR